MPTGIKGFQRTNVCPKGHDKDIVERRSNGGCKRCANDRIIAWNRQHVKYHLAFVRKRQIAKIKRTPKFGQEGITDFYTECPGDMVVDHTIPLQGERVSGLHVIWNLQYLTPHANAVKHNSYE